MTLQELYDQAADDADDTDSDFETKARRWLNLARSYIATKARWRDAFRVDTFATASTTTTGLYTLTGYEHLTHDVLWDETNDTEVVHESYASLNSADASKSTTGPPTWWGDAGTDTNDQRQIYLWPVPDGSYTIRFSGYKLLEDLTEDDDTMERDPFFGSVNRWAACFAAGIRYYHDLHNNEDAQQTFLQKEVFEELIADQKRTNVVAPESSMRLRNVRTIGVLPRGRFSPAHFNNR